MKQSIIPQDEQLSLIMKSKNVVHLIALIALYLENEYANNKISEFEAISYILNQAKNNQDLLDEVAA